MAMLAELQRRITDRENRTRIYRLFPDTGPLRRELYPKHLDFFSAGAEHQERALIGGNRTGKTLSAAYEVVCHLLGWYPHWWAGRRFDRPVSVWACGEDAKAVRESVQETLLGKPGQFGTGLIPGDALIDTSARGGVPDAVDAVRVRHKVGESRVLFKTYDQGRESYQGAKIDVIWFDEEPPASIYSEGLTRTMSTVPGEASGIALATFTPLRGISDVVLGFLPGGKMPE